MEKELRISEQTANTACMLSAAPAFTIRAEDKRRGRIKTKTAIGAVSAGVAVDAGAVGDRVIAGSDVRVRKSAVRAVDAVAEHGEQYKRIIEAELKGK